MSMTMFRNAKVVTAVFVAAFVAALACPARAGGEQEKLLCGFEKEYIQKMGHVEKDGKIVTARRGRPVPLSEQAISIVKDNWPEIEGVELLFPSLISNRKWLSENAFNSSLRRMGYQKEEVTAHGFRATASTILNSRGYEPDVIEAALAHQDKNVIRRTYNRATYLDQRVKLMQVWADLMDEFQAG